MDITRQETPRIEKRLIGETHCPPDTSELKRKSPIMFRTAVSVLFIVLTLAFAAAGQSVDDPPTVTPDGGGPLSRVGQATRAHLLGADELYTVALYADRSMSNRAHLASPDVPKALRIAIKYKDNLLRPIPYDWRPELIPRLDAAGTAHLRGTFAPLRYGDMLMIEYVPGKGTFVRVNKAEAVSGANHDLMLAFLDHWIGQRPLSEEIKRALVNWS
jgi:Chalcone isomerase-like